MTTKKAKPTEIFRARLANRQKCVSDRLNACQIEYRSLYKDMAKRKKEIEIYEAVILELNSTIEDFDETIKGEQK